jgi:hypothetical protein
MAIKCQIMVKLGDVHITNEVSSDTLGLMTPSARRRAWGALVDQIYNTLRKVKNE